MSNQGTEAGLALKVEGLEEKNANLTHALIRARQQITELQAEVDLLHRPPAQVALYTQGFEDLLEAEVLIGTRRMRLAVAPDFDFGAISPGALVRLDENNVVVAELGFPREGGLASVLETIGPDRALVTTNAGQDHVVTLAGSLRHGSLRAGDNVLVDLRQGYAFEKVMRADVEDLLTPEVPDVSYDDIGGLEEQLEHVRDAIELPFTYPQLFKSYDLKPPRGILLYGPPGCGKTLIAKAVAASLSSRRPGEKTYFISIKGPELLNKFVGETERHIRAIFSRARALARNDVPVVVFFDEMEALFRTRGTGVSSDVETMIVPQLLAEMDGLEELDNVVVIGASNRPDMIDPAVLRPGRLDVRIRIERPTRAGAADIFSKYLTEKLPIAPSMVGHYGGRDAAVTAMTEAALDLIYSTEPSAALFDLTLVDGSHRTVYLSDLVSGAMIAGAVERAKKAAIKDTLSGEEPGVTTDHMLSGVTQEMRESVELATTTSPDEWARTIGLRGAEVTAVVPLAPSLGENR